MHIYLTGFMGVGKTTIGKELSERMNLPFIDLDIAIENEAGISISQYFETHGEVAFRALEQKTLLQTIKIKEQHIVALGGGTMASLHNGILVIENGICVYLKKPWDEIQQGLENLEHRPMLDKYSLEELEAIFRKREPFYAFSQLTTFINTAFSTKKLHNYLKLLTNR